MDRDSDKKKKKNDDGVECSRQSRGGGCCGLVVVLCSCVDLVGGVVVEIHGVEEVGGEEENGH